MTKTPPPLTKTAHVWKEPVQARGRARVKAILDSALALTLEIGHLDLKMTHVAQRAGVPIGSVYQFFPTRDALIGRLYQREMEPIDAQMRHGLTHADSLAELGPGIQTMLHSLLELVRSKPGLSFIWASAAGHPAIQQADLENTRTNAAILSQRLSELAGSDIASDTVNDTALIICHVWGSVIRLCLQSSPSKASRLIEAYAGMIESRIRDLLIES